MNYMHLGDALFVAGYLDGLDGTLYKRSHSTKPPDCPEDKMPPYWKAYFDGWRVGVQVGVDRTMESIRQKERTGR